VNDPAGTHRIPLVTVGPAAAGDLALALTFD
jgi:hypothetical protein